MSQYFALLCLLGANLVALFCRSHAFLISTVFFFFFSLSGVMGSSSRHLNPHFRFLKYLNVSSVVSPPSSSFRNRIERSSYLTFF